MYQALRHISLSLSLRKNVSMRGRGLEQDSESSLGNEYTLDFDL